MKNRSPWISCLFALFLLCVFSSSNFIAPVQAQEGKGVDPLKAIELAEKTIKDLVEACARPRALGIIVTNQLAPPMEGEEGVSFTNPEYWLSSGQCDDPPSNEIKAFSASDPILFSKTNDVARGTVGLLSYRFKGSQHKLVVMWSVPYDYNLYENWWNLDVVPINRSLDKDLWDELYKNAKKNSKVVLVNRDGVAYEIAGSMGTTGKTTLKVELKKAEARTIPKIVRIRNYGTGKWLTHEGGVANQNWISSTPNQGEAVVWEVVGNLDKTQFRARNTNLFLSFRGSTGACKFVDSADEADFKMEFQPNDDAWTASNNYHQCFLWMYSDPYPYVRGGGDGDNKAKWVFEEVK